MSAFVCATLLVVCLSLGTVFAAVPKCDPAITSKMSQFHPNGIPTNIIQSIQSNGLYSYVVVSTAEGTFLGLTVKCIGISMADINFAQVTYGVSLFPKIKIKFAVKEDNGILVQTDGQENKLYVLYLNGGVIFTYRCCDTCTATAPNVGIAVADGLKDTDKTKTALAAAKALMSDLGLDKDVVTLSSCS